MPSCTSSCKDCAARDAQCCTTFHSKILHKTPIPNTIVGPQARRLTSQTRIMRSHNSQEIQYMKQSHCIQVVQYGTATTWSPGFQMFASRRRWHDMQIIRYTPHTPPSSTQAWLLHASTQAVATANSCKGLHTAHRDLRTVNHAIAITMT